jgi:hypothetical protein
VWRVSRADALQVLWYGAGAEATRAEVGVPEVSPTACAGWCRVGTV